MAKAPQYITKKDLAEHKKEIKEMINKALGKAPRKTRVAKPKSTSTCINLNEAPPKKYNMKKSKKKA